MSNLLRSAVELDCTQSRKPAFPPRVGATVIFYLPDAECVERVNRLSALGLTVIVVDNTPQWTSAHCSVMMQLNDNIRLIKNEANLGIAAALNLGVSGLIELGSEWALLFDQDSEPSVSLVDTLPQRAAALAKIDPTVALVGPAYHDKRLGSAAAFVRFRPFRLERIPATGNIPIDVDFLISSGSCINLDCWAEIGPMESALFIDFVDLEWCARARRKGFRIVGLPDIHMIHELGGEPIKVFGRRYPSHSAMRHYYLFRNAIALIMRRDMPPAWKSSELIKLPIRLAIYGLFCVPRRDHLRMACKGVFDGLRGRLGPLTSRQGKS